MSGEASAGTIWDNCNWYGLPENEGRSDPVMFNQHLIQHLIPDAKFILILRDPTERYVKLFPLINNESIQVPPMMRSAGDSTNINTIYGWVKIEDNSPDNVIELSFKSVAST